ncbi:MAG: peptidoglycan DD-metalloendopeptidase family protein, partial [Defluviitaleaceae bacterium]|nr:peptidoglycan DD-metalloendopeptidase family protein [Defluviitaleaceae bacterium]
PNPEKDGYRFVGWFSTSAQTGGTHITTNTIVPLINITFWARWEAVDQWTWPVPGSYSPHHPDWSHFRPPSRPNHNGIDITPHVRGVMGDDIVAFASGEIRLSQYVGGGAGYSIYINTQDINGFNWIQHRYLHLMDSGSVFSVGHYVQIGQVIARMGDTGDIAGAGHLHFETRRNNNLSSTYAPTIALNGSTPIDPIANFFPDKVNRGWRPVVGRSMASGELTAEERIILNSSVFEIFADAPGRDIPYTLGNLSLLPREYVWNLGLSIDYIQYLIYNWGLYRILAELNGLGLEHLGFYMQDNGKLIRISEKTHYTSLTHDYYLDEKNKKEDVMYNYNVVSDIPLEQDKY